MPTLEEFAALTAAIAEAVAACEYAQAELLQIHGELDALIAKSRALTAEHFEAEARARNQVSRTAARLACRLTQAADYGKRDETSD